MSIKHEFPDHPFPTEQKRLAAAALTGLVLAAGLHPPVAHAGTGSCAGAGAISVSDARVGECGLETGDNLSITGTGSITGDGTGPSVGVRVGAGQSGVNITNAGEIVGAPSDGLWNQGSIDQVTNSGRIVGGSGFAVGVYNPGVIDELDNSGVIEPGAGQTLAILSPGTLNTLNNSGEILGGIETSNTTINLSGSSARITGAVTNTGGTVNVRTGAAFTTENAINTGRLIIESGARLQVGASGHGLTVADAGADAMLNTGTLEVAEGVTANVTGNYEQSGTLRVGASSSASHGRLSVTGNANLTSTARFDVDVNTSQTLAAGDTLSGVLSATGALTNAAPAGNVSDNSALFNFRSVTNGNQVDLQVEAAGSTPEQPSRPSEPSRPGSPDQGSAGQGIVPATVRAGLVNGVPAAQVLDGYIRGGRTGTDWDAVVTALGQLPDDASVAQAVGQAMPSMHGNASRALLAHASSTGAALVEQLAWSGLGSGDAAPGTGLWVKPMSTWVEQDRYRQISGYRVRTQGLVGGYQTSFGPGSTIGFGLAYLDGRVEGRDFATGQRSDLESVQLLGYGSYDLSGWRLQWQADATRSSVKSLRWLGFIGRSAQASYRGNTWHIGLNIGRPMDMSGTTVTPSVGLDWRRTRSGAYTETGAGALNLRVAAQTAEELIVKLGVQARHPLGRQTHLLAMAAVGYDLASGRDTTTAQFTGGGTVFSTQGLARRRAVAELGLGVTHRASDSMELSVRYDLMVREGLTDQGASLRLDWRF